MPALVESIDSHIQKLNEILTALAEFELLDLMPDLYEAQWYEPWDLVFNWLRMTTSLDLTVAPQCRIVRILLRDAQGEIVEENWSDTAVVGSEDEGGSGDNSHGSEDEGSMTLKLERRAQIPDFILFFKSPLHVGPRIVPLVVEIKPPPCDPSDTLPSLAFTFMIRQTLLQARHVFEGYPHVTSLHVLCIFGLTWHMYPVNRNELRDLPVQRSDTDDSRRCADKIQRGIKGIKMRNLLNDAKNDYSPDFKAAWNTFTANHGIPNTEWQVPQRNR